MQCRTKQLFVDSRLTGYFIASFSLQTSLPRPCGSLLRLRSVDGDSIPLGTEPRWHIDQVLAGHCYPFYKLGGISVIHINLYHFTRKLGWSTLHMSSVILQRKWALVCGFSSCTILQSTVNSQITACYERTVWSRMRKDERATVIVWGKSYTLNKDTVSLHFH